ncbi:hypothetical protein [Actinoplanes sp. L3-i22]|uniref:hypothetical protein n=1 Tax=Actinoplanes sp. L3-i22 TaxID=2836373 RepID=UPI001C778622|nr:hypothetical protein [Actinoplanes sp. L3-i22]BCY08692.1 hypothetical protein L3i22_037800 [Actinoplanes sp. L3-i22]
MIDLTSAAGVTVGDSTWDSNAVRTGGFVVEELENAGAVRVFDSLDETPLANAG